MGPAVPGGAANGHGAAAYLETLCDPHGRLCLPVTPWGLKVWLERGARPSETARTVVSHCIPVLLGRRIEVYTSDLLTSKREQANQSLAAWELELCFLAPQHHLPITGCLLLVVHPSSPSQACCHTVSVLPLSEKLQDGAHVPQV